MDALTHPVTFMKFGLACLVLFSFSAVVATAANADPGWHIEIVPPPGALQQSASLSMQTARNLDHDRVSRTIVETSGYVQPSRVQNFNRHILERRQDIASQLSTGTISASDAYALNGKLDSLMKAEYRFQASGGITQPQLSQLYADLRRLQIAGQRSPWFF